MIAVYALLLEVLTEVNRQAQLSNPLPEAQDIRKQRMPGSRFLAVRGKAASLRKASSSATATRDGRDYITSAGSRGTALAEIAKGVDIIRSWILGHNLIGRPKLRPLDYCTGKRI
jgi:hypothetical protein